MGVFAMPPAYPPDLQVTLKTQLPIMSLPHRDTWYAKMYSGLGYSKYSGERVLMKHLGRVAGLIAIGFLLVASELAMIVPVAASQQATPASNAAATPTALVPPTQVSAAEQQLADKYVPIAYLRTQPSECSTVGEPYIPIAVDITLNNPEVKLRRRKQAGETSDPVVKVGPSAQDLVDSDPSYYIDLPGNSLEPGCGYAKWSRQRIAELGLTPSVYAHITTQADRPGKLALQYWFYYAFDSFNNSHESDWEMIQLTFDANTPEEALKQEPSMLSYAQHSGGENAQWGDDNVQMEDGHLVTFPGEGSHADYYQSAVWLAWGENGSGFGCDQSQEDLARVTLKAIVIPQKIDPNGPFAWTLFQGRWGEYHPWQFNGPKSPNMSGRWMKPIGWTDDLRSASYPVPHTSTFGVGPGQFFCTLSTIGGTAAKQVQVFPQAILGVLGAIITILLLTTFMTRRYLWGAIKLYGKNWSTYLLSSILLLAVAAFTSQIQRLLSSASFLRQLTSDSETAASLTTFANNGSIGFLMQLMLIGLVAPGIITATVEIRSDAPENYRRSIRDSLRKIPTILGALLYNYLFLMLMSITIVLIPLAVYRQIQWSYTPHAILIDGAGVRSARHVSRNIIKGDWFRTLGMAVLVTLVTGIPGPIIGLVLILLNAVPLEVAGYISSLVFAISYPIAIIASTLYYLRRKEQHAARAALESEKGATTTPTSRWRWLRRPQPGVQERPNTSEPAPKPAI